MGQMRRKAGHNEQMGLFSPLQLLPGRVQDGVVMTISGQVADVLYVGISHGRMEFIAALDDGLRAKITGRGDPVTQGDAFEAHGEWVPDPKYGRRFDADRISTRYPETTEGIVRYLSSGAIKGVTKTDAQRLEREFGDHLPKVMALVTELVVAGLTEEKAAAITTHWTMPPKDRQSLAVLYSHKVGEKTAKKILKRYGDKAPSIVVNQPYRLADDIKGIGFKKADAIALSQNMARNAEVRIRAGLKATARAAGREGDTCQPRGKILIETAKLLALPEREIRDQEEALLKSGELTVDRIAGREVIYDTSTHECEEWVASDVFARLIQTPLNDSLDELIDACADLVHERQAHFQGLHEGQHAAVKMALSNKFSIITGGPGVGKTATMKTIIACLKALMPHVNIVCTAPTGAAGQRIMESTGHPASTIHSALKSNGETFRYGKEEQLQCDVFIVDESSMIDLWLMRHILEALPSSTRIILIGDPNQLPSVGQGNVLNDLIECRVVPVARLTKVYRQGAGSQIAFAAEAINEGRIPKIMGPSHSNDNWTVIVKEAEAVLPKLTHLATQVLPYDLGWNGAPGRDIVMDFQVITPGHQHETGTRHLNTMLQAQLNPEDVVKGEHEHKGRLFRRGDKVVQTANDDEREIFNGNIGRIVGISKIGRPRIVVEFRDREVLYERGDLDALYQAWAITAHRSQGSEAKAVAPILTYQHYIQLKRNLYYTALTRARELCCTIGQYAAIRQAVTTEGSRRLTGLAQRLAAKSFMTKAGGPALAF